MRSSRIPRLIGSVLALLVGPSTHTFALPFDALTQEIYAAESRAPLVVGDFNLDGSTDIATLVARDTSVLHAHLQVGGSYQRVVYKLPTERAEGLLTSDLDADGRTDLIVRSPDGLFLLYRRPRINPLSPLAYRNARLALPTSRTLVTTADVDTDGYPEIILAEGTSQRVFVIQNRDGTLDELSTENGLLSLNFSATDVQGVDFDGDDQLDLAVTGDQGGYVYLGDGTTSYSEGRRIGPLNTGINAGVALGVTVGDFFGDGRESLLLRVPRFVPSALQLIPVEASTDDGGFHAGSPLSVAVAGSLIASGDFSGDGATEVLVAERPPRVRATTFRRFQLKRQGPHELLQTWELEQTRLETLLPADLNDDGLLDVVALQERNDFLLLLMQQSPRDRCACWPAGDSNGDGTLDLADPIATLFHLFHGAPLRSDCGADADADGTLTLTDAIVVLNYLFQGGPKPLCRGAGRP